MLENANEGSTVCAHSRYKGRLFCFSSIKAYRARSSTLRIDTFCEIPVDDDMMTTTTMTRPTREFAQNHVAFASEAHLPGNDSVCHLRYQSNRHSARNETIDTERNVWTGGALLRFENILEGAAVTHTCALDFASFAEWHRRRSREWPWTLTALPFSIGCRRIHWKIV